MRPAVGRSTPVSRLMIVVLPAPFGPISAWRAPFSTDSETSFAATMPPNCLVRPLVSSTGGIVALRLRRSALELCSSATARSVIADVTFRICGRTTPSTSTSTTVKMMLCMNGSLVAVQIAKISVAITAP